MNKYYKSGSFIIEMRKLKGFSQNDLSQRLNITRKAVSRWENGWGLPDSSLLLPLAQVLGVTVDEILNGELSTSKELSAEQIQTIEEMNSFLRYKSEKKRMVQNLTVYLPIALASVIGIVASNTKKDDGYLIESDFLKINCDSVIYILSYAVFIAVFTLIFYDIYRLAVSKKHL